MARNPVETGGAFIRAEAYKLDELADRWDASEHDIALRQHLHDELEEIAGELRAVGSGRGFR